MPIRSQHNRANSNAYGYTGSPIHACMDRAARSLRHEHRKIGHGWMDMMQMAYDPFFRATHKLEKFTPKQIFETWSLHVSMDTADAAFSAYVKKKNKNYGKKVEETIPNIMASIKRTKNEFIKMNKPTIQTGMYNIMETLSKIKEYIKGR